MDMPKVEQGKVRNMERIVSPEEWKALAEIFDECSRSDVAFSFEFDTGRYSDGPTSEVIQGEQGWTLDIGGYTTGERFRSIRDLVNAGRRMLAVIATEEHLAGHVEFED